jgi:hypothetical protein
VGPLESEGATARRDYYDSNWRAIRPVEDGLMKKNDLDSPEVASSKLMILQLKVVEFSASTRPEKCEPPVELWFAARRGVEKA